MDELVGLCGVVTDWPVAWSGDGPTHCTNRLPCAKHPGAGDATTPRLAAEFPTPYIRCSGSGCLSRVLADGAKCTDCVAFEARVAAYTVDETAQRHGVEFAADGFPREMRGGHLHFCPKCNQHVPCEEYCSIEPDLSDTVGIYRATPTLCDGCRPKTRQDEPDYEARMLRGALEAIALGSGEGALADAKRANEIAEAALCPHKWEPVTVSGPAEPRETDVVCSTCGVNQHEFLKMVGLEE